MKPINLLGAATALLMAATPVVAQTTNPIFLDCDVNVTLREPDDGKASSGKIYYKIDTQLSDVSKFDVDNGKYKTLCSDRKKKREIGVSQGGCDIYEDFVFASGTALYLGFTVWENVSVYRYSGKISTSTKIYSGNATEFEDLLKRENITHRVDTQGTCKQGTDMSLKRKAF